MACGGIRHTSSVGSATSFRTQRPAQINTLEKKNTRLKTRFNTLQSENRSLRESVGLLESTVDDTHALMSAKEKRLKSMEKDLKYFLCDLNLNINFD